MPAGKQYPLSLVLTAVDRVTAPLNRVTAALNRATAPVRSIQQSFGAFKTAAGVDKLNNAMGDVTRSIAGLGSAATASFGKVTVVVGAATAAAYLFNRQFIGTASTFENLEFQLEAIEGSAEKAKAAMAFIKKMTVETPFEMEDIAKTFRVMRGFGMDPAGGALQAIVDQVSKLGLTGEHLTGIALQLGQAFSKGRLQAQDANILVENGVPVWQLLQRAIARVNKGQEVSIGQLREWSEEGKLGLKSINLLIEQMGLESKGAALRMMETWTGMVSQLSDAWTFFKQMVMKSGVFDFLKQRLGKFLERLKQMSESGELDRIAKEWGDRLVTLFTWLEERGVPMAVSAFQTLTSWLQKAADIAGGWENLAKFGMALFVAAPIIAAIGGVVLALGSLAFAVGATPVGLFLAGLIVLVSELALWAVLLMANWKKITTFYRDLWSAITDIFDGFSEYLNGVFTLDMQRAIDGLKQYFKGLFDFVAQGFSLLKNVLGVVGHSFGVGAAAGQLTPTGAPLGADRAAAAMAPKPHQLHADVNFSNMPPGTRVSTRISDRVTLDLTRGYAMAEAR